MLEGFHYAARSRVDLGVHLFKHIRVMKVHQNPMFAVRFLPSLPSRSGPLGGVGGGGGGEALRPSVPQYSSPLPLRLCLARAGRRGRLLLELRTPGPSNRLSPLGDVAAPCEPVEAKGGLEKTPGRG